MEEVILNETEATWFVLATCSKSIRLYPCTSNWVEYEVLYLGLNTAFDLGIRTLKVRGDSELVIQQMRKEYRVSSSNLIHQYTACEKVAEKFMYIVYEHVDRSHNEEADELAREAAW